MSFDGKPVPRISRTEVTVRNFGSRTISRRHVHQKIGVEFPATVTILGEPEISSTSDDRVQPTATTNGTDVDVDFDFLEPGDELHVIILSTASEDVELVSHGTVEGSKRGIEDVISAGDRVARRLATLSRSDQARSVAAASISALAGLIAALLALLAGSPWE